MRNRREKSLIVLSIGSLFVLVPLSWMFWPSITTSAFESTGVRGVNPYSGDVRAFLSAVRSALEIYHIDHKT